MFIIIIIIIITIMSDQPRNLTQCYRKSVSKISGLKDDNKKTEASWIARFKSKKFGNVVSREWF